MRLLLAALALATLAGCDRFTDDPSGPAVVPPGTAATLPPVYIKGPATILQTRYLPYRAEPIPGATTYQWGVLSDSTGAGGASIETGSDARLVTAIGVEPGPVTFLVTAYRADGTLLARGTRRLVVE